MEKNTTILLASASPRRAELLHAAGINFSVHISPHKEPHRKPNSIPTQLWPMCLAFNKAQATQTHLENKSPAMAIRGFDSQAIILAADTIVVESERILNKARNRVHAQQILTSLSGKTHQVITGICLMSTDGKHHRLTSATATCRLHLTKRQLETYLNTNLWKGKAGAYGIQDDHDPFVTLLQGDITTVIGLPMQLLKQELATFLHE